MKGYGWKAEQLEQVRKHYGRLPVSLIAKAVGRSPSAVRNQAAQLGIGTGRREWTSSEIRLLRERYQRDGAIRLAVLLGRTESAIYRKASDLGLEGVRGNGRWRQSVRLAPLRGGDASPQGP